jgi:O-antigen/teichoic acid export membrane protein
MSLKKIVAANYASQIYVAIVGLAATPLYLHHLGAEAYGLVGFYGALMAWFQLLDVGLSPVVMREVARHAAGSIDDRSLWAKIRAIENSFAALVVTAIAGLIAGTPAIADRWLNAPSISAGTIHDALRLMILCVGLRFASVLYRGILTGLEHQVWLGGFNAAIASARAFLVIPAMTLLGDSPTVFFATQLVIGLLELSLLGHRAYRYLPKVSDKRWWDLSPLLGIWRFSATVAFTGGIGIAITQSDRLILSGLLDLNTYGYFSLVVLAASAILLVGAPLGSALQPRLTRLLAGGDAPGAHQLFRDASQLLAVLTVPAAVVMAVYPDILLLAWTGNAAAASTAATTLALYALGNLISAQLVLPYSLQFAYGRLRPHLIGNLLLAALLIPGQILATQRFGASGAGACWLLANLLYALVWIPIALWRIAPHVLRPWYLNLVKMVGLSATLALLVKPLVSAAADTRVIQGSKLVIVGLLMTALLAGFCPPLRRMASVYLKTRIRRKPLQ